MSVKTNLLFPAEGRKMEKRQQWKSFKDVSAKMKKGNSDISN